MPLPAMTSVSVSTLFPEASTPLLAVWWKVLQATPLVKIRIVLVTVGEAPGG